MKMIFTAITGQALLTISARAQSQAWVQRYSHTAGSLDSATKVLTDADGDCIMVGYGNSGFSGRDWIIFKCNSAGFPLWTNRFSGSANADDTTQDAVLDSSGNLYVTGYAYDNTSGSSSAGITVKYSTTGEAVWTNQYRGTALGNNWATRIAVSTNGTVVILAENSDSDLATVAYSNSGIPLWTNRYDGAGHGSENPGGIAVDRDGNVFVTGKSIEANADFVTIAYSLAGNPLWTNFFNGSANGIDSARTVAVDSTGQVIVTGSSQTDTGSYQTVTIAYSNGGIPLWTNFYASSVSTEQVRPVAMSIGRDDTIFVMAYTPDSAKANASDYLTIAYSNAGVLLWANRYNGPSDQNERVAAGATDTAGNLFVTGFRATGATNGFITIAYAPGGVTFWTNQYRPFNQSATAYSVASDKDGNVFVMGNTSIGTVSSLVAIKYSGSGVPLWTNVLNLPGNNNDIPTALAVDGTGKVFVTGFSMDVNSGYDYLTIAYSRDGVPLWTNRYNGPGNGNDYATNIVLDAAGRVFVTGTSKGANGYSDYATLAYSNDGVPLWTNRYNGASNANAGGTALTVTSNGKVVVTGYSAGAGTGLDHVTIAYSTNGIPLWVNRVNGTYNNNEYPAAICADSDGNVFVTGFVQTIGSGNDFSTVKYSDAGSQLWMNRFNGSANLSDAANAVAVDKNGTVYVTGGSYNGFATTFVTVAYSSAGMPLWTNVTGAGSGNAIAIDSHTNAIVTGTAEVNYAHSFQTIKFSDAGVAQWTNIYSGASGILRSAVAVSVNVRDDVIVTGYGPTNGSQLGHVTIAYSGAGEPLWTNFYHGPADGSDYPIGSKSLGVASDGSIYVTGASDGDASTNGYMADFATIKYAVAPSVLQPLNNQIAVPSGTATFSAAGYGTGPLTYKWYFNSQMITGATNEVLTIPNVASTNQGTYQVFISSPYGSVTGAVANLTIALPPRIDLARTLPGYSFKLSLTGTSNVVYRIETSTNLWQWMILTNFSSATGEGELIESNSAGVSQRFYRAVYVPSQ